MSLFAPDDFSGDPYGWLTNQAAHMLLGFGLALWLGAWVMPFFALWEISQVRRGGGVWDSIEDGIFVALGVALALHPEQVVQRWIVLASLPLFARGIWTRL